MGATFLCSFSMGVISIRCPENEKQLLMLSIPFGNESFALLPHFSCFPCDEVHFDSLFTLFCLISGACEGSLACSTCHVIIMVSLILEPFPSVVKVLLWILTIFISLIKVREKAETIQKLNCVVISF